MSQYHLAMTGGLVIADCQLPIADFKFDCCQQNRKSKIDNLKAPPLPRGGTYLTPLMYSLDLIAGDRVMRSLTLLILLVLALVQATQLYRIKQVFNLRFSKEFLLPDNLEYALT